MLPTSFYPLFWLDCCLPSSTHQDQPSHSWGVGGHFPSERQQPANRQNPAGICPSHTSPRASQRTSSSFANLVPLKHPTSASKEDAHVAQTPRSLKRFCWTWTTQPHQWHGQNREYSLELVKTLQYWGLGSWCSKHTQSTAMLSPIDIQRWKQNYPYF